MDNVNHSDARERKYKMNKRFQSVFVSYCTGINRAQGLLLQIKRLSTAKFRSKIIKKFQFLHIQFCFVASFFPSLMVSQILYAYFSEIACSFFICVHVGNAEQYTVNVQRMSF
jgi:hypothetical protein